MEVQVARVADVIFKYTWQIANYKKRICKRALIDSDIFHVNVNGINTEWSMSIRFWKDPKGKTMKIKI